MRHPLEAETEVNLDDIVATVQFLAPQEGHVQNLLDYVIKPELITTHCIWSVLLVQIVKYQFDLRV